MWALPSRCLLLDRVLSPRRMHQAWLCPSPLIATAPCPLVGAPADDEGASGGASSGAEEDDGEATDEREPEDEEGQTDEEQEEEASDGSGSDYQPSD